MRMKSQLTPAKEEQIDEEDSGIAETPVTSPRLKARRLAAVEEDRTN